MRDETSFGAQNETWATVTSKSVKKAKEATQKMPTVQIEIINSVLYEDKEREEMQRNLWFFGLENQGEDSDITELSKKVEKVFLSIGLESERIQTKCSKLFFSSTCLCATHQPCISRTCS